MRRWASGLWMLLTATVLVGLGGCTTGPTRVAMLPPPPARAEVARPLPPAGIPDTMAVPTLDTQGRYRTINSGLSADQTAWHVRSALNVAVLACRGPGEATLAADYNALLRRQKAVLAAAYAGMQTGFRTSGGKDWQMAQDMHATRVYNFFALPPAKPGFCAAATEVLVQSRTVLPTDYAAFAATALPQLEAPFVDVYRAYDGYRRELAAWEAADQTTRTAATTSPAYSALSDGGPRLAYVGVDMLGTWEPAPQTATERLAVR